VDIEKKKVVKKEVRKSKIIDSLSMYIKEVKYLRKKAKMREIAEMRSIHSTREEVMSKRGDFVVKHSLLKKGAKLFREKKYQEALEEFQHVINQYPEDMNLQAIATKNISICYKKMGNMKEFIKYYTRYYELVDEVPEDKDGY
jgi:tetratricopeptide (TPR) repeat protein